MANLSKFIHSECSPVYNVRFLVTPESKYVFDIMYRQTIVLTDGHEYSSITDCFDAFTVFISKLDKHEPVNAVAQ